MNSGKQTPPPIPQSSLLTLTHSQLHEKYSPKILEFLLHWSKRLLACNPFFLVSAALILYGMAHISDGKDFFENHYRQLSFNFFCLQSYEALLVLTALVLARRKIWYDSTLLAFLEAGFLLVPFILLNQAVYLGASTFLLLGGLAIVLPILRLTLLRKFFVELCLPWASVVIAMFLILLNAELPLLFRWLVRNHPEALSICYQDGWHYVLPLVAGLGLFLPKPKYGNSLILIQHWIPIGFFLIWVVTSSIHMWSIGYVYSQIWKPTLLIPLAWSLAWLIQQRIKDFTPSPTRDLENMLLIIPILITAFGIFAEDKILLSLLSFLNSIWYFRIFKNNSLREPIRQLAIISLGICMASLPREFFTSLSYHDSTASIVSGLSLIMILEAFVASQPATSFFGSVGIYFIILFYAPRGEALTNLAIQNACVFALLHSYFWRQRSTFPQTLIRCFFSITWISLSFFWLQERNFLQQGIILSYGGSVIIISIIYRLLYGRWGIMTAPIAGNFLCSVTVIRLLFEEFIFPSKGICAMMGSFLFLGMGMLFACTKKYWNHQILKGET